MNISELKEGTLLEIYIRRDGYNYKVVSKIEYVDDMRIGVTPIASRTKLFKFKSSDVVDIVYRMDDKSWKWSKVRAGSATLKDGTKLHVFIPEGPSEVYNRRTTYRLPMAEDIVLTYEVLETREPATSRNVANKTPELTLDSMLNEISESYREYSCKAILKDLSEGGAAVFTTVELRKGDIVSFELKYGDEPVKCRALVVRIKRPEHSGEMINYGLSYIETSSNYTAYFFAEQRRMLSESKLDYFK